jgi:DNA-binding response OmpR family regulator
LVVSAFGADRDRHATAAAGFDGHLVKPLDAAAIAAAIHALRMR